MRYFKRIWLVGIAMLQALSGIGQEKYEVNIDLRNVVDDQVKVTINVPAVDLDSIEYHMPKIVPGTYSISDFGRFLHGFKALDDKGKKLEVSQITVNRRLIKGAQKLKSITYWVEDSYDTRQRDVIFEPAGTNIEAGENYIINTFGFVGYLDGLKDMPYEVTFDYPTGMFGASALQKEVIHDSADVFKAPNYFDLADGPIMYCEPDTASIQLGNMDVLIAIYSPNKKLTPKFVKEQVYETLKAQQAYLGGELPVDNYAFLIYLFEGYSLSGGMGALEHSYSSLYSLPEVNPMFLAQTVRDVAAHEFFHIVTPLNIHSEEIGDFDFINPKMSKHLWLYEGITEYAAGLAQVKYGNMSMRKYINVIEEKIRTSERYMDELPFTELSKGCLDKYEKQYYNVYQKGALIGMVLDIKLRKLSNGAYGVQDMMNDLAKEYGKTKSFKDDELFDKITKMTYPEIGEFFTTYVAGTTPLDYQEALNEVGIFYQAPDKFKELSLGHISFGVNEETNRLVINEIDHMNKFAKEMGYERGDEIFSFDGVEIDIENYDEEFAAFKERHKAGDLIEAVVLRANKKGKKKKVKLSANAIEVTVKTERDMKIMNDPTERQLALRKAWINK